MAPEPESSFASLVSSALNDVRELFRQEISLAKYEVREELSKATTAIVAYAAAAIVALFAVLFILTAVARGFAMLVNWPIWAGFGIVGILLALVGAALFFTARSRMKTVNVVPRQTAATIKEDVQWLKQQTRSVRE
jgi:multidrug transporter EmrE-like cation transporter